MGGGGGGVGVGVRVGVGVGIGFGLAQGKQQGEPRLQLLEASLHQLESRAAPSRELQQRHAVGGLGVQRA